MITIGFMDLFSRSQYQFERFLKSGLAPIMRASLVIWEERGGQEPPSALSETSARGAAVYGADIDRSILFTEDRIKTFEVDQTSPESFERLLERLPSNFDLVIDDGLHAPDANILTLSYGLKLIKSGGWVVIEDILEQSQPIWQSVAALLPSQIYDSFFIRARSGMMFAVHRKV
jgi:hypothetical protein